MCAYMWYDVHMCIIMYVTVVSFVIVHMYGICMYVLTGFLYAHVSVMCYMYTCVCHCACLYVLVIVLVP